MVRRRPSTSVVDRVREHRARLRSQGLRPIQIWVPDVRSPEFAVQAHLQSQAVAASDHADEDQAFIDALTLPEE
jgi:hypothetical protein